MANACVFCGADDRRLTDQHVVPDWLSRFLDDEGHGGGYGTYRRAAEGGESASWRAVPLSARVKVVCESCNTGWMSQIEGDAQSAIGPMVVGRTHRLRPPTQRVVATWAYLTALMTQHANPTANVVPAAHYDEFHTFREPSPDVLIWTFAVPRLWKNQIHDCVSTEFVMDEPDFGGLYVITFTVGLLGFQVIGVTNRVAPINKLADLWAWRGLGQVWPLSRRFDWPVTPLPCPSAPDPMRAVHDRIRVR